MGGTILMVTFIIIVSVVAFFLGVDMAAYSILSKAEFGFKRNMKTLIPGYCLYTYIKWRKQIKP